MVCSTILNTVSSSRRTFSLRFCDDFTNSQRSDKESARLTIDLSRSTWALMSYIASSALSNNKKRQPDAPDISKSQPSRLHLRKGESEAAGQYRECLRHKSLTFANLSIAWTTKSILSTTPFRDFARSLFAAPTATSAMPRDFGPSPRPTIAAEAS